MNREEKAKAKSNEVVVNHLHPLVIVESKEEEKAEPEPVVDEVKLKHQRRVLL